MIPPKTRSIIIKGASHLDGRNVFELITVMRIILISIIMMSTAGYEIFMIIMNPRIMFM